MVCSRQGAPRSTSSSRLGRHHYDQCHPDRDHDSTCATTGCRRAASGPSFRVASTGLRSAPADTAAVVAAPRCADRMMIASAAEIRHRPQALCLVKAHLRRNLQTSCRLRAVSTTRPRMLPYMPPAIRPLALTADHLRRPALISNRICLIRLVRGHVQLDRDSEAARSGPGLGSSRRHSFFVLPRSSMRSA